MVEDDVIRLMKELQKEGVEIEEAEAIKRIGDEREKDERIGTIEARRRAKKLKIFETLASNFLKRESIGGFKRERGVGFQELVKHLIAAWDKGLVKDEEGLEKYLKEVIHSGRVGRDSELKLRDALKKRIKQHFEDKPIKAEKEKIDGLVLKIFKTLSGRSSVEDIKNELETQKTDEISWEDAAVKARKKIIIELKRPYEERKDARAEERKAKQKSDDARDRIEEEARGMNEERDATAKQADEEEEKRKKDIERMEKEAEKKGKEPKERDNKIYKFVTEKGGSFSGAFFVVLGALLIFYLDRWARFDGIDIKIVLDRFSEPYLWARIFWNGFVAAALIAYPFIFKPDKRDFVSYALLIALTSVIVSFGALNFGFYHFVIVYSIYFIFIPRAAKELGWDKAKTRYFMSGVLFIDYFGFGLASYFGFEQLGNRYIFPLWSYVILILKTKAKPHWFSTAALFFLILWTVVPFTYDTFITDASKTATQQQLADAAAIGEERKQSIIDQIKAIYENTKKKVISQMEFASGGYYEGQVEEHENIPLGVYFKDMKTSVLNFNEDEPIEVWGNLLIRALDDEEPVNVSVGCEYPEEHIEGKMLPRDSFEIYTMEEEAIECRFDPGAIPAGTRRIRLTADFNFKTMSYLKSYMIDKETLRAFRRDDIDVFKHYGITDKNPIAVFTNGPIQIGMETNTPPIGIDSSSTPYLGITIENLWSGNIRDIREKEINGVKFYDMVVQIPKGFKFFQNCDDKFSLVKTGYMADDDFNTYILTGRGRTYMGLPIKVDEKRKYRSLRCLMQINEGEKDSILGNVPFTTRYFRTTISYDYELMQEVTVNIKSVPKIDYFVTGGTCNAGTDYNSIFNKINDSDLKDCWPYLDIFNYYYKELVNDIDLLMVLAVAQKATGCEYRGKDLGGMMGVEINGTISDYSDVVPVDVELCKKYFEPLKGKVCCDMTNEESQSFEEKRKSECGSGKQVDATSSRCPNLYRLKEEGIGGYDYDEYGCKPIAHIQGGVILLAAVYDAVKKKNAEENYGFDNLKLAKFALLGYDTDGSAALEAMRYHHDSIQIHAAMKAGCEKYFRGKTDSDGYDVCTGTRDGTSEVRPYGTAYPNAVFDIYGDACNKIGGTGAYAKEETIT